MRGQGRKADAGGDVSGFVKDRIAKAIEAEAAAALPAHGPRNAALFALDDLAQARGAMRHGMVAHFNADIAAAHFMCNGGGRAGTKKAIKNEVIWVGGNLQ